MASARRAGVWRGVAGVEGWADSRRGWTGQARSLCLRSSGDEGHIEVVADDEFGVGEGFGEGPVPRAAVLCEQLRHGGVPELGMGIGFLLGVVVDQSNRVCAMTIRRGQPEVARVGSEGGRRTACQVVAAERRRDVAEREDNFLDGSVSPG